MRNVNELLRSNSSARDEYLIRIELHSRLASDANLFSQVAEAASCRAAGINSGGRGVLSLDPSVPETRSRTLQPLALAACLMLIAGGGLTLWFKRSCHQERSYQQRRCHAGRAVDARWSGNSTRLRVGGALEPGWVRLQAGLAQVVFYSGARVVIEGPTELKLISPTEAVCVTGRLLAEVPPAARGFRVKTAQINVVDRGTAFGIDATRGQTEVHVFKGEVEFSSGRVTTQSLSEGRAAMAQGSAPLRLMAANTEAFASMFELQTRSLAAEAIRYDQWRVTSERLTATAHWFCISILKTLATLTGRCAMLTKVINPRQMGRSLAANARKVAGERSRRWNSKASTTACAWKCPETCSLDSFGLGLREKGWIGNSTLFSCAMDSNPARFTG
jgi:hypothetical protein